MCRSCNVWSMGGHCAESREQGSNSNSSGEIHILTMTYLLYPIWRLNDDNCTQTDSNAIMFTVFGRNVSSDGNSEPSRIAGGESRQYLQREPWRGGAVFSNELTSRLHRAVWSVVVVNITIPFSIFCNNFSLLWYNWDAFYDIEFPYILCTLAIMNNNS